MTQFDRAINMGGPVNTAVDRGDRAERRLGARYRLASRPSSATVVTSASLR